MKLPFAKWPVWIKQHATVTGALVSIAGVTTLTTIAYLSHLIWTSQAVIVKSAGHDYNEIIEIYQPEGTHTLQDPPTDVPPIILEMPKDFHLYNTKGPTRVYTFSFFTFYPRFTSLTSPENDTFGPSCTGYCNGQMYITIENRGRNQLNLTGKETYSLSAVDIYARKLLIIKKSRPEYQHNLHITEYEPEFGFDVIYDELYTKIGDAPKVIPGHYAEITRYYLRFDPHNKYYDLIVRCHIPSENSSTKHFVCALHFVLSCAASVYVQVSGVDGNLLPEFGNIRSRTDQFISAMMMRPTCDLEKTRKE